MIGLWPTAKARLTRLSDNKESERDKLMSFPKGDREEDFMAVVYAQLPFARDGEYTVRT